MADYSKMYTLLFNKITDALKALEEGNADEAKTILINAQITAEDMYIDEKTSEN